MAASMEAWPLKMITSTSGLIFLISLRVASHPSPHADIQDNHIKGVKLQLLPGPLALPAALTVSPLGPQHLLGD